MKTIYTLLLAFGLCLTVHSQSVQNYDTYYNQASSTEKQNISSFLNGAPHKLIYDPNQKAVTLYADGNDVKMIEVMNLNGFSQNQVNNNLTAFAAAKMIKIYINSSTQASTIDLSAFTQLQYVVFELEASNLVSTVNTIVQTITLPQQVQVLYRYQTEM